MKASTRPLLVLLVLWSLSTLPTLSQGFGAGRINGEILPPRGESNIPHIVTVRIVAPAFQRVTYAVGGRFSFQGLPPGNYVITAVTDGREETVMELPEWSPEYGDKWVTIVLGPRIGEKLPSPDGAVVDVKTLQEKQYDQALKYFGDFLKLNPEEGRAEVESMVTQLKQHFRDALARDASPER